MKGLKMVATGRSVPQRVVTNEDMCKLVETSDEWIVSRTGIKARHYVGEETTTSLAVEAAKIAIARAGIDPRDIGACVVATVSPDSLAPTVGCRVHKALDLPQDTLAFDLNVGCTGFIFGLHVVRGLLLQSEKPYVLLIGAESLTRVTNFEDRGTCVLFGDGAGAVLLALDDQPYYNILGVRGDDHALYIPGLGMGETSHIHMDGQAVFRFAVEAVPNCINNLLQQANLTLDDIAWIIPHQANRRIVETAAKRLGIPLERFYLNIERYGNSSAATIPMALAEMDEQNLIARGQKIICVGFGAGLTWGGILLEW